mgnify:CR=1 FL=1
MLIALTVVCLARCQHHYQQSFAHSTTPPVTQTLIVKNTQLHQSLFFSGIIQPIQETALTSPVEAVIESMPYDYGQKIPKNATVLTLNSVELEKQYNDTLTDYLKSKDNFGVVQARFHGTQELWDAGLISKNNYLSEQSSVSAARISLLQATKKLSEILQKTNPESNFDFSKLDITQFEKVQQVLNDHHNRITIQCPATGVLLYPPKASGDTDSIPIKVGSSVKAGQVIGIIGDIHGIHVDIDIPEIDINKIHEGMAAKITGAALGAEVLTGKIIRVNTQAIPGNTGKNPSFSATVAVEHLTASQRAVVRIGMSAEIELLFDKHQQIIIPIGAIHRDHDKTIVTIQKPDGSRESRPIITGIAQADTVVVVKGLKPGEVIIDAG